MEGFAYAVEIARGNAVRVKASAVRICRGEQRGCTGSARPSRCPDCYRVAPDDPRSTAQILADMERGDA